MIQAINQYLSRYDLSIDELLTFRLEKTVTIQVWQVGFLFRILQIAIVTFFVFQMYVYDQWALIEIPVGSLNAWSQARNFMDDAGLSSFASLPYCNNASYAYTYDSELDYTTNGGPPVCEALADWEVVQKTGITAQSNSLIFMTVFIEKSEFAWPCAGLMNDTMTAKCLSDAGTLETTHGGSQCKCEAQRTVYPVGVDKMGFAFEHNIKNGTNFADIGSNSHEVTDETANPPVYGIISKIRCANGTDIQVPPGTSVGLSLQDWIGIASTGSAAVPQVSLDGAAADLKPDDTRNGRHPPFRTSGIALQIRIEYDNLHANDGGAGLYNRQVYAKVTPSVTTSQWAGNGESSTLAKHRSAPKPSLSHLPCPLVLSPSPGPITIMKQYPTGTPGQMTYDKVFRYRQGVVVTFSSVGRLYKWDWQFFLLELITVSVMLRVAKTVAGMYAIYGAALGLGPKAEMIRNKTREQFNINLRFADIGIKAVVRAFQFAQFDKDKDGEMNEIDIVQSLALIGRCSFDQAYAMAHIILKHADVDTKLSHLKGEATEAATLDFVEYMQATESAKMVPPFEKYLTMVEAEAFPDGTFPATSNRKACKEAFDEVRQKRWPHGNIPTGKSTLSELSSVTEVEGVTIKTSD